MPVFVGINTINYALGDGSTGLDLNIERTILQDDYVLVGITQDQNQTFNTPQLSGTNMTLLQDTFGNSAETFRLYGRKATADSQTINSYDWVTDDHGVIYTLVFRDVDTATVKTTNNGNSATPSVGSFTTAGTHSTCVCFAAMDADAIYIKQDTAAQLGQNDPGPVSACVGYMNIRASGGTCQFNLRSADADTWKVVTVELTSDTGLIPVKIEDYCDVSGDRDATSDIRDSFYNDGVALDSDGEIDSSPNVLDFDCNTTGTTITPTSGTPGTGSEDTRTYKLTRLTGTLNTQLTDGEYYYVTDSSGDFTLRTAQGVGAEYADSSDISLTAQTGTARLTEVGLHYLGGRSANIGGSGQSNKNWYFSSYDFASTTDLSGGIFKEFLEEDIGRNKYLGFVDSNGYYKYWRFSNSDTGLTLIERFINVENNTDFYATSTNTFDETSVDTVFWVWFSSGSGGEEITIGNNDISLLIKDPKVTGNASWSSTGTQALTMEDIFRELQYWVPEYENLGSDIYRIPQNLTIGDGTTETDFTLGSATITFQPIADNDDTFKYYTSGLSFNTTATASDDYSLTNTQVKFDSAFDAIFTTVPNSLAYTGNTIIKANFTAVATTYSRVTFVECTITAGSSTLDNCVLDDCNAVAPGNLSNTTITNATNGIVIASAGTYDVSDLTFTSNTNDIEVTATTGTVNIQLGSGQATPSFTTAGATVNFLSTTAQISAPNLTAGRIQVINETGRTAAAWAATTAYSLYNKVLRSTGTGSESGIGLYFQCTTAGTSGGSEPTWDTTPGNTTSDGTVTWTCRAIEFDNDTTTTGYSNSWINHQDFDNGDTIRMRWVDSDEVEISSTNIATEAGTTSFLDTPEDDDVYDSYGIDGSTVTEYSADYPNIEVDVTDPDNVFYLDRFYAWHKYNLTTADGIRNFFGAITATDTSNIKINNSVVDIFFDNTKTTSARQGDNIVIQRSDGAYPQVTVTSGGGGLGFYYTGVGYSTSSGSGLDTTERNKLLGLYDYDPTTNTIEGSLTYQQAQRVMLAESAGKVAVAGSTVTFRDQADTKDRITATTDSNGQRTSVTLDGT